jgi:Lysophospholipase L1 and related esterases
VMVDWLDSFREWLQRTSPAPLIDFYSALWDAGALDGRAEYFSDGGHPNRAGYAAMAEAAFQALSSLLVPPTY